MSGLWIDFRAKVHKGNFLAVLGSVKNDHWSLCALDESKSQKSPSSF